MLGTPDEAWPRYRPRLRRGCPYSSPRGWAWQVERDSEAQKGTVALRDHLRPSPTRLQRLANVAINQLGLTILDVDVEPREDGRVALVLPKAWMYLML